MLVGKGSADREKIDLRKNEREGMIPSIRKLQKELHFRSISFKYDTHISGKYSTLCFIMEILFVVISFQI